MQEQAATPPLQAGSTPRPQEHRVPFGVNEVRLDARQWAIAILLLATVIWLTPRIWKRVEQFQTGPDYRIPYQLSKDYWLYQRRLSDIPSAEHTFVLGDSVVWGEYVLPNGTLSHFLNAETHVPDRFINAGVNGLFPLALEGLIRYHAAPLRHQKVLLQCNVLWMSSPKADLSVPKEEKFNHSRLVPQFSPRIPCYRADMNERLGATIERNLDFLSWVSHLQDCYFEQKSILSWTMEEDGSVPPRRPNAYKNPFAQVTMIVPTAPAHDAERGPDSTRHKPWTANASGPSQFEWVSLDDSLQWGAFQRLVTLLQDRGDDLMVVLGPFNEHMVASESRPAYQKLKNGISAWLEKQHVPRVTPETLPSELYADASHPLTDGYALLARNLYATPAFRQWLGASPKQISANQSR